jgi:Flp pilus assembly protein TadG
MFSAFCLRYFSLQARRLGSARDGNIAVIFAIALLPIFAFIGAAVDYSRANMARSAMQSALDSTALMLSRDLSQGTITSTQIGTTAQNYFSALYTNKEANSISVSATYTAAGTGNGPTIVVNGSGSIPTDFMKVVGLPSVSFSANSTTSWGANLLRVALVLDNTGSMADSNKIGALQSAAKKLVTQLSALAQNNGDVMISVVPFEIDVNVGTSNVGASWLRWDRWDPNMYQNPYFQQSWCSDNGWTSTLAQCQDHGYRWTDSVGTPTHSQWNGCVTDRDKDPSLNYDISATAPTTGTNSTLFIADQDPNCPAAAILPLTYNWSTVNSTVNAMSPGGATNQTIGLQWGWLSLLQQSPLNAPAETVGNAYQHIIILFTDGLNTGDRWYGNYSSQSSDVDTRMKMLCQAIKNSGVTIYTVQIDTDGAGQSAVLPACATDSSKSFMLTQASQIAAAFSQIGTQIAKLRVAK